MIEAQDAQVGKFYLITMDDSLNQYRVRVTKVTKKAIKGKYVPFDRLRAIELTGAFPFKNILSVKEI